MKPLFFLVALSLCMASGHACAGFYSFSTAAGSKDAAGEPVSAKATFSLSAGSMVVTVVNLQADTVSVGQDISSIFFTLSSGGAILSLAPSGLVSSSGTEVAIGSGGVVTSSAAAAATHWAAGAAGGQSFLNDLSGGGSPIHTIIGPAQSSGNYTTVNASIAGNFPHNPFMQKQAVFVVNAPGLLPSGTISAVSVGFGTTPGNTLHLVPEPGTLFLFGLGGLVMRLRRPA